MALLLKFSLGLVYFFYKSGLIRVDMALQPTAFGRLADLLAGLISERFGAFWIERFSERFGSVRC
jgi:hypothetical protein